MRILALAASILCLGGVTAAAFATEIVVLVNGSRMDVKSYEVQNRIVVVTTWEGDVQSFPLVWVDLEATKSVSHRMDPTQGVSPERLEKAQRLMEAYGVREGVSGFFGQLENEIRSMKLRVPRTSYEVVYSSFRSAFDGDRIFDVVAADFAKNVDDSLLDRWGHWLEKPETKRVVAMENAGASDSDAIERTRYLSELYADGNTQRRRDLVAELVQALHASQTGLEIVVLLADALRGGARIVLPTPPPEQDLESLRDSLRANVEKATLDSLLYSYRTATHEELSQYLAFWKSPEGRRIAELMMSAIVEGARYGSDMAVHNVRAGMGVN